MKLLAWILGLLLIANASGVKPTEADEELRGKVQSHIDAIVDEGAAIVDDVAESLRENGQLEEAEKFVQDVIDVAGKTAEELEGVFDSTKALIEEKFGTGTDE